MVLQEIEQKEINLLRSMTKQTWHPGYWGLHSVAAADSMSILDKVFR